MASHFFFPPPPMPFGRKPETDVRGEDLLRFMTDTIKYFGSLKVELDEAHRERLEYLEVFCRN